MPWYKWSKTPAANSNADPSINWSTGMSASSVEPSGRAMMTAGAQWRDDISGTITTGGTLNAYTVTSNQVFDTLALMNGAMIAFVPHTTNGAIVTLNVDGLGAKPLRSSPAVELGAGVLVQGSPYVVTYNNSDGAFYLQNFFGNPFNIPVGGMMPYVGATAPNANFVLPFGQAISRITYAGLFAITSTTFGSGDGTTTFNVPDLRGRSIFGQDNMGGSAASRITSAGSGIDGTSLGAAGGAQNVSLARANLPNVQLTVTGTVQPKVSGVAIIAPTVGAAATTIHDGTGGGTPVYDAGAFGVAGNTAIDNGATASINGGVTQTVVNEMPPAMVLPYILRVI